MSENFCSNCGARLDPGAGFCTGCGQAVSQPTSQQPAYQQPPPAQPVTHYQPPPTGMVTYSPKSPGVAAILGLLLPGIGTIYAGKALKGIIIFLIDVFIFWTIIGLIIMAIIGAFDAHSTANQYNRHLEQYGTPPNW